MNKNIGNLNNLNKPAVKEDDCNVPSKSVAKSDNKPINVESVVKNGETRTFLNNLAKKMLEDLKDFSTQSVELFNTMNEKITHEYHMFLKHASDHKKKVDGFTSDHSERMRKMEILKMLRERFSQNEN